jgi:predicted nucleic acid-binding protein
MSTPFIDTDVIIRLLTGDDPAKQAAAATLLTRVEQGELTVAAPDTVIADAVFVLSSKRLYNIPRAQIAAMLTPLVRLSRFRVQNRRSLLAALAIYGMTNLDFRDALIVAAMQSSESRTLYSYDQGFDRIATIQRQEP